MKRPIRQLNSHKVLLFKDLATDFLAEEGGAICKERLSLHAQGAAALHLKKNQRKIRPDAQLEVSGGCGR